MHGRQAANLKPECRQQYSHNKVNMTGAKVSYRGEVSRKHTTERLGTGEYVLLDAVKLKLAEFK